MLCYLRLHVELALRAKGLLLLRESGFAVQPLDDETRAQIDELRYLERSLGKTGSWRCDLGGRDEQGSMAAEVARAVVWLMAQRCLSAPRSALPRARPSVRTPLRVLFPSPWHVPNPCAVARHRACGIRSGHGERQFALFLLERFDPQRQLGQLARFLVTELGGSSFLSLPAGQCRWSSGLPRGARRLLCWRARPAAGATSPSNRRRTPATPVAFGASVCVTTLSRKARSWLTSSSVPA